MFATQNDGNQAVTPHDVCDVTCKGCMNTYAFKIIYMQNKHQYTDNFLWIVKNCLR
jgi:hypothetical protein